MEPNKLTREQVHQIVSEAREQKERPDLSKANLIEADLSEATLSWADLREADLSGTTLREADLN